jgi:hypothetical protein
VLFSAETPLSLTTYVSVIRRLAERGHEVTVSLHVHRDAGWRESLLTEVVGDSSVSIEYAPYPDGDRWLELALDIRKTLALYRFLTPTFNETYRARAWKRAPRPAAALARTAAGRHALVRRSLTAALELAERALPANDELERYLADHRPDVVLFTPYMGLDSVQPDFLRAARGLGLRTAICVKSWDNLSSKSVIRPIPDRLFVWNEIQREEAMTLHGVPPERVAVTGAQCFDEWFDWQPSPRDAFCARAGLDAARPYVLYACCGPWTGQSEADFVRRWVAALRAHDGLPSGLGVLVRPHPKRDEWGSVDRTGLPGVVVFPEHPQAPTDQRSKADYFDSIYHSAAVVGLNTTAMVEAGIVGRPVLTVLDPEYDAVQRGTLHFRHLLEVGGGVLRVAETLAEHTEQLAEAVAGDPVRNEAFVREFVRPHGLDVAATPLFVEEVERLAAAPPPQPQRPPLRLLPLRPVLAALASRTLRVAPAAHG